MVSGASADFQESLRTNICWYTKGITAACRMAAILCCMAQIQAEHIISRLAMRGAPPPNAHDDSCQVPRWRAFWPGLVQNRSRPKFVAMNAQRRPWGHRMLFACRLMELEATPGIEPGYTVLQANQVGSTGVVGTRPPLKQLCESLRKSVYIYQNL